MPEKILIRPPSPPITADSIGLGNVDNTSDADKPVSTAQALANAEDRKRANHTGTQLANTISDFTSAVNALITGKADVSVTDSLAASIDSINAILASNDVNLDELQEIVDYITANRASIDALGISSIIGLQAALDAKQDALTMATQLEMETGTETALRGMSPLLVHQAISAVTGALISGDTAGGAGFSLAAPVNLPAGFTPVNSSGYEDPQSEFFGNIQYQDGSIMCVLPKMYYRIGHVDNPTYADYGVNSIHIEPARSFTDTADAIANGFALPRIFMNAGVEKDFRAVDKYMCSKNSYGAGIIASSRANQPPLSTSSSHNPVADLTACNSNNYYQAINACHARDGVDGQINPNSRFNVATRFDRAWLAMLSLAHGQAATSSVNCGWYDPAGVSNFPKGCNNNALGDVDDNTVIYISDGYSNCGKTGSANSPEKVSHNGQKNGVMDLNGIMWEIELGLTRGTENDKFWILDESVDIASLQPGSNTGSGDPLDAWGNNAHLATLYRELVAAHITNAAAWIRHGNAGNMVLGAESTGERYDLTSIGLPVDANAQSASGTSLFGNDGVYQYYGPELCTLSGANWSYGSIAGAWAANLGSARTYSNAHVGFRAACYI